MQRILYSFFLWSQADEGQRVSQENLTDRMSGEIP